MEPLSKLNRADRQRRILQPILFALFVALSVGLLQRQLSAIYARPAAVPATLAKSPLRREDAKLFEQALAVGLLRLDEDGRIAVAPADLPLRQTYARAYPELLVPRAGEPDWLGGTWNDEIRQVHRALHFSVAGRYVRQQVEAFNARQWLAAVRWRSVSDLRGDWRADWCEAPLTLTATMPLLAGRLLSQAPLDWQPWRRVARWPALEGRPSVRFRLALARPARPGERLELLVVGGTPTVIGGTVLASEPRCLQTPPCAESEALARWLRLELREGAVGLDISFSPLPATAFPDLYRYEFAHIQREDGRLVWRDAPAETAADPVRLPEVEAVPRERPAGIL